MNALILNVENLTALQVLNENGDPSKQLNPVPLTNGNWALNADLLEDCGLGETWEHYAEFLQTLNSAAVDAEQIQFTQIS
jgi:hypothetical protein